MVVIRNRKLFMFVLLFIFLSRVCSAFAITDITGPNISEIAIKENGQTLTVGDTIHVSAKITDESGVSRAYLYVAQNNYACDFRIDLSYNSTSGRWEGSHTISDTDINGTYHIMQFDTYDIYNNHSSYYDMDENYNYRNSVTITGARTDAEGPVISDFKIAENGQTLTVGETIHVSARISDASGISRAYIYIAQSNYVGDFRINLSYNNTSDLWEGSHTVSESDHNGIYHALQFDAYDSFNNHSSYYDMDENYEYINSVTITGAVDDSEGPQISDFRIDENGQTLTVGDVLHVSAKITDMSGVSRAYVYIATSNYTGDFRIDLAYNNSSGRWEGSYTITEYNKDGIYHAVQFDAYDMYNTHSSYYDMDENYEFKNTIVIYTGVNPLLPKTVTAVITNIDHKGKRITPAKFMDTVISFTVIVRTPSGEYKTDLRIHPNRFDKSKFDMDLVFPGEMPVLETGKYEIKIKDLNEYVYDYLLLDHKYFLLWEAWINDEGGIEIYLIWSDEFFNDSTVQIVHALPEDETGAYAIGPDGTKQYLIFQTYDICMAYLGSDELCSGNERCYHK